MTVYFEDFEVGRVRELGAYTLTEGEMREFAERYDPQPFHVDEGAAIERGYDGLIASGWQTIAISNRIVVDGLLKEVANVGGLGADDVRWHAPVYAGDTITVEVEVTGKRVSESTGHGVVHRETRATTDDGPVLSYTTSTLVERRDRG